MRVCVCLFHLALLPISKNSLFSGGEKKGIFSDLLFSRVTIRHVTITPFFNCINPLFHHICLFNPVFHTKGGIPVI